MALCAAMSRERLKSIIPYVSMNPVPGHRHPPPMLWSPPPETSATTSSLDLVCAYICVIPIHISQILPIIYIYIVYMFPIATSYMTCYALHTYMLHMCYVYITRRVRMNTYSLNTTVLLHVAYACKPRCHLKTPTIQTLYMYLCALNTLPLNFQHVPYTLYNTIRRPQTRSQNIFYIYYLYACFITCHMQYGYI